MNKLKLLFVIVNRAEVDSVQKSIQPYGSVISESMFCDGTANNEALSILGIAQTEKALMIISIPESATDDVFKVLNDVHKFSQPNKGIAFTVPISAMGGPATYKILSGELSSSIGGKNNGK